MVGTELISAKYVPCVEPLRLLVLRKWHKKSATCGDVAFATVNHLDLVNLSNLFHMSSYKFLVDLRSAKETDLAALVEYRRFVRLLIICSICEARSDAVFGEFV